MDIDFGNGSFSIKKKWRKGANLQVIDFLVAFENNSFGVFDFWLKKNMCKES